MPDVMCSACVQCLPTMNAIFPSVFEACHKIIDYSPFVEGCEFDVCHMHLPHIGCSSLKTYAKVCAEAGVCIDWRSATDGLCGMQLDLNLTYSSIVMHSKLTNNVTGMTSVEEHVHSLSISLQNIIVQVPKCTRPVAHWWSLRVIPGTAIQIHIVAVHCSNSFFLMIYECVGFTLHAAVSAGTTRNLSMLSVISVP